jgi:hypothetical protein
MHFDLTNASKGLQLDFTYHVADTFILSVGVSQGYGHQMAVDIVLFLSGL